MSLIFLSSYPINATSAYKLSPYSRQAEVNCKRMFYGFSVAIANLTPGISRNLSMTATTFP